MPIISYFFGIIIRMYFDDHNPPHFHAEYQGSEALFSIADGNLLEGTLPPKAIKLIQEWALKHQQELIQDWELASHNQPVFKIPGADND